ncbi:hypothetical protein [Paraburkholderia sp. C35]|jgi:hypothetical protein|uniref:hypothetical protein n=1 Tax=Paraburkholderia sp. C35 TaxID=2126993 RepID=UPI0013A5462D|nr:hypothetical protein [Paraburkholderia sp. C35]
MCVATSRNFIQKLPCNVTATPKRTKKKQGGNRTAVSFTQHDLKSRIGHRERFGIFFAIGRKALLDKGLREAVGAPDRGGHNVA